MEIARRNAFWGNFWKLLQKPGTSEANCSMLGKNLGREAKRGKGGLGEEGWERGEIGRRGSGMGREGFWIEREREREKERKREREREREKVSGDIRDFGKNAGHRERGLGERGSKGGIGRRGHKALLCTSFFVLFLSSFCPLASGIFPIFRDFSDWSFLSFLAYQKRLQGTFLKGSTTQTGLFPKKWGTPRFGTPRFTFSQKLASPMFTSGLV